MNLDRKSFILEVKDSGSEDNSVFEGYSAALGNKDLHNDIITPGAFKKTIKERVASGAVKLLDNHNARTTGDVLGSVVEAREEEVESSHKDGPTHKLWTKFSVSSDENAQRALKKVREGHLNSLSIGYRPIKVEYEKDEDASEDDPRWAWLMGQGTRHIKELAWYETSIVLWPANESATIIDSSLKTLDYFTQFCKDNKENVPQRYVEAAVKSLNNLIDLDVDYSQLQEVKQVIENLKNGTEELGTVEKDIFAQLIAEYKETQDRPSRDHFFLWFADQVKDRDSAEFEKEVGEEDNDSKDTEPETEPVEGEEKASEDTVIGDAVRAALDHLKQNGFIVAAPKPEHDEPQPEKDDEEAVESTSEEKEDEEAAESTSDDAKNDDREKLELALKLAEMDLNL